VADSNEMSYGIFTVAGFDFANCVPSGPKNTVGPAPVAVVPPPIGGAVATMIVVGAPSEPGGTTTELPAIAEPGSPGPIAGMSTVPPADPTTPAIAKSDAWPPGSMTFDVSAIFRFDGFGGFTFTVAVRSPAVAPVLLNATRKSPPTPSVRFAEAPLRISIDGPGPVSDVSVPTAFEPFAGLTETVATAPASAVNPSDAPSPLASVVVAVALGGLFHAMETE
jgi:hypothetical protein